MGQQVAPGVWEFESPAGPLRGQGATEADAKLNALNAYHQSLPLMGGGGGTAADKKAKEPDFVGRAKAGILGALPSPEAGLMSATAQAAGETFLPGSLEELAVQAATLGAPGVAKAVGAGGQVAKAAIGVGLPTAAGAATGGLGGAALGAGAGAIGEATKLFFQGTGAGIEKLTRYLRGTEVKAFNERVRSQIGPKLAHDIGADIPSLRKAGITLTNVPDVVKLLDDSTGRQVVGKMFDTVEEAVAKKVGSVELPREALQAAGRADLLAKAPGPPAEWARTAAQMTPEKRAALEAELRAAGFFDGPVPVSGADAIAIAKQLRFQGLRSGPDAKGHAPRELANAVQQKLDVALGDSPLKAEYAQLRDDYSKFMDLRDWLVKNDPSKLFPGMVSKGGATIDLVAFGDRMMKDIADLPPSRFPNLHALMTGEGSGTRAVGGGSPVQGSMGLHVPGTPIYLHPKGGKAKVPETPSGLDVGKTPPGPIRRAGGIVGGVGRAGVGAGVVPSLNAE